MEEEEERGCVCVRLVSGWRGALGTGGEEHTGCTPPAGGEGEIQQPVEAAPSQPSHPEIHRIGARVVRELDDPRREVWWWEGNVRPASAQCRSGRT